MPELVKEAGGPASDEGDAEGDGGQGIGAGPVMNLIDEEIFHWVGDGVDHLRNDIIRLDQFDDRSLLRGGPKRLPPATKGILVAGK